MKDIKQTPNRTYKDIYQLWRNSDLPDNLKEELFNLDENEIREHFYKYLDFGTGGIRGEIGVGTNRMNVFIIRRVTKGLSQYICKVSEQAKKRGVVIAYDSRRFSREFAEEAALVLATNGITTYLFSELRPTPVLSFAVRELKAIAGIVITASHNPPEYNGYKVYWEDGGQLPPGITDALMAEIEQVENELEVKVMSKEAARSQGLLQLIDSEIDERYQKQLTGLALHPEIITQMTDRVKIVYTPLHGTGNKPVREILKRVGFKQVLIVPEQELPDPNFSTVKSPNPEEKAAFYLAIQLAKEENADLILGTDPDTDRVGVVVQNQQNEYVVLTGNQTGALMLDYLLSQRKKNGNLPANGVIIKTIVTSEMGKKIADLYGVETVNTLTGFKFIGEKIKEFETTGEKKFLFGYEESYGYLIGDFVRDKDAVQACLLISEMTAYYKAHGISLYEALHKLYERVGYYQEDLVSITLKGILGQERIERITASLRDYPYTEIAGFKIHLYSDYLLDQRRDLFTGHVENTGLPKSDVLHYTLEDESWFAIRPSGTEPKIKIYFSVVGESDEEATKKLQVLKSAVLEIIDSIE